MEFWQLRKGTSLMNDESHYEEELFVAGHTVTWSRGTNSQASYVYKAFTVDSPVEQVLKWICIFCMLTNFKWLSGIK